MARVMKEDLYLKYEFDNDEKLAMATTLASNHNAIDDIDAEEKVFKSQIKERREGLAQSIQMLSRKITMGFEMRNIPCAVEYDKPNINEVQYVRLDTGEVARHRAMTESERQQELEFSNKVIELVPAQDSVTNIAEFFGDGTVDARTYQGEAETVEEVDPLAVFSDQSPGANLEAIKPEHDALFENVPPKPTRTRKTTPAATNEEEPF